MVDRQKKVIILTDSSASIQPIANGIAAVVGAYSGYQTDIIKAEDFNGVELLPTCAFFLGCESPKPTSFTYIEDMLEHINLAGRPCGIFSSKPDTLDYLSSLLKASEAVTDFSFKNGMEKGVELHNWVQSIIGSKA
jgi:hypothetical protein